MLRGSAKKYIYSLDGKTESAVRTPFIIGNWKLNPARAAAEALAREVVAGAAAADGVEVGIAPPYPHLPAAVAICAGSVVLTGAQDASEYESGAYTGEVSAAMLAEHGCAFAIVGHSERRHLFGESDARVAAKVSAVHRSRLSPVLCLGETLAERDAGRTLEVVRGQLDAVFAAMSPADFEAVVVAYEPVWAIGTGKTATPEAAQQVHAAIRAHAAGFGVAAERVRILYGGSVKPDNAAELFAMPDIDGGLVGGASLVAPDFLAIVAAARRACL